MLLIPGLGSSPSAPPRKIFNARLDEGSESLSLPPNKRLLAMFEVVTALCLLRNKAAGFKIVFLVDGTARDVDVDSRNPK